MILGLFDVPAEAEAEREAAARKMVECRDLFREHDRIVLHDQRDTGTESQRRRRRRGTHQRDEWVERAPVLLGQRLPDRRRRTPRHGDVRVLRHIHRLEAALFGCARKLRRFDAAVGKECGHADAHHCMNSSANLFIESSASGDRFHGVTMSLSTPASLQTCTSSGWVTRPLQVIVKPARFSGYMPK